MELSPFVIWRLLTSACVSCTRAWLVSCTSAMHILLMSQNTPPLSFLPRFCLDCSPRGGHACLPPSYRWGLSLIVTSSEMPFLPLIIMQFLPHYFVSWLSVVFFIATISLIIIYNFIISLQAYLVLLCFTLWHFAHTVFLQMDGLWQSCIDQICHPVFQWHLLPSCLCVIFR